MTDCNKKTAKKQLNKNDIKHAATGRWAEILDSIGGIDSDLLDGRGHPCPQCGGDDRFSAFPDFKETGGVICRKCHSENNGDGIATIGWLCDCAFPEALAKVAEYLGIVQTPLNGKSQKNNGTKKKTATERKTGLAEVIENQLCHVAKKNDDKKKCDKQFADTYAKNKPGIKAEQVLRAGGQACAWPKKAPAKHKNKVIALYAYRSRKQAEGNDATPTAVLLLRTDGKPFPAVEIDGKQTLGERKSHNLKASKDSLIPVGSWQEFDDAENVVLCEGPPDALAVAAILPAGWLAITNTNGAGTFDEGNAKAFKGKNVFIVMDCDEAGKKGEAKRAALLFPVAQKVSIVRLPYDAKEDHGKDLRDWIVAGGDFKAFGELETNEVDETTVQLMEHALQDTKEKPTKIPDADIANWAEEKYTDEEGKEKTKTVPISMNQIIQNVKELTNYWPRRVDNVLFIDDPQHGIDWFDRRATAGLFGWLRRQFSVNWTGGPDLVSQKELFSELERTSKKYNAIELYPHYPEITDHYYRCSMPQPGDGTHLNKLLDCFRPETTIDRDLILAMILTQFWGGPPGCRPAFVITSDHGRGVGKTKLAELVSHLVGGCLDVSAGEDISTLKQRFLSPEGQAKRVAILDNVKTMKLSWAELESLITTPTISGKRLYVGECQRPNTITWIITLNGVSLATDMAQRSVIVKLVRGRNDGPWYENTMHYIDQNREAILGDVLAKLQSDPEPLDTYTRWAAWEKGVLSKLPEPSEAQRVIMDRQSESNCELDEAGIIEDYIAGKLTSLGYLPKSAQVRIPVSVLAQWYNEATGDHVKTSSVTRKLNQMKSEGSIHRLTPDPSRANGRCFVWTGENANIYDGCIDNGLKKRLAEHSHN